MTTTPPVPESGINPAGFLLLPPGQWRYPAAMFKKAITVFVPVAAIIALCLIFAAYSPTGGLFRSPRMTGPATLLRQVQSLSQLVTVKYVLEKVVDVRDTKWYPGGENKVLLVALGIVNAGINLTISSRRTSRSPAKKSPSPFPIPSSPISIWTTTHTRVLDRTTGLLRAFDKDLEQNARKQAVDELRVLALDREILKDAQERAKSQLTAFFLQAGFAEVEIKSH